MRILIVEDDRRLRQTFVEMLQGWEPVTAVLEAGSLAEAQAIDPAQVDLIILNLGLPDSQGVATAEAMAQVFPRQKILVVTGERIDQVMGQFFMDRHIWYLMKGHMNMTDLHELVLLAAEVSQLGVQILEALDQEGYTDGG